jgi:hypothetical protein
MSDNETQVILVKFICACLRILAIGVGIICATYCYCYCANQPKVVRLQVEIVGGANAKEVAE